MSIDTSWDSSGFFDLDCEEQATRTVELLTEIVTERGADFVYPRAAAGSDCVYVEHDANNGMPSASCLVAQFYHRLGMPLDQLASWEQNSAQMLSTAHGACTSTANILQDAQSWQDKARTWGAALEAAIYRREHGRKLIVLDED